MARRKKKTRKKAKRRVQSIRAVGQFDGNVRLVQIAPGIWVHPGLKRTRKKVSYTHGYD